MNRQDIPKICADSLRNTTQKEFGTKLKAAHAHELVAAYLGYKSKNSLLAESKFSISNLSKAEVIVMVKDEVIDKRRNDLKDFPENLPDSYTLGESVYTPLFTDEIWNSQYPPFRSFEGMAKYFIERNEAYKTSFKKISNIPVHHFTKVVHSDDHVVVEVIHSYKSNDKDFISSGRSIVKLERVAGMIGFTEPTISFEIHTSGARRIIKPQDGGSHA